MHRMLIDGKLVAADRTYPSVNPATGQVLDHATVADAQAAVAAARRAFDATSWATDAAFRAHCLDQLHTALTEHKEELRELTIADAGAPRAITYGAQLDEPIGIVRYCADLLPGYPLTQEIGTIEFRGQQHRRWVEKEPAGVVAAIIGYNYPTLLSNVDPDSEIAQEEVFGPVLAIIPHDGDDDAVRIANNSIYGLSGAVFGGDADRALAVARRIRTGTIGVNGGAWFGPDVPFGGFKQSGVGREMGAAGLEEFLESKSLAIPVTATS